MILAITYQVPFLTMSGGRPLELDHVLPAGRDGTPITVAEHLLERIALGVNRDDAAASANISRTTLYNWKRRGINAQQRRATGATLEPNEARLVDFVNALERAEAESEATRLGVILRAATGGATVTKTTRKYQQVKRDGVYVEVETERSEVTETLRPEWTAAAWWLERTRPHQYARTVRTEVSGPQGGPVQLTTAERAARMADDAQAYLQGIQDAEKAHQDG